MSYQVKVAYDQEEGREFVQWLIEQGHQAELGGDTGSYIDGVHTATDSGANETMNRLWADYCNA